KRTSPAEDSVATDAAAGEDPESLDYSLGIEIVPYMPRADLPLTAEVRRVGGSAAIVEYRFAWYVNELRLEDLEGPNLPRERLKKGDRVYVEVKALRKTAEGTAADPPFISKTVTIGNKPPFLDKVMISPAEPSVAEPPIATPRAFDLDQDLLTYRFVWFVNGAEIVGASEARLPAEHFSRGDQVRVRVVPRDGQDDGNEVDSATFEIKNSPPEIVSSPPKDLTADVYIYPVRAEDADGDPLVFSLDEAPPGMEIQRETGVVRWAPGETGRESRCVIAVDDGAGGKATQEFGVRLDDGEAG
ncbi:MAG: hypothetical protein ACRD1Z_14790, partial [Vicinamibacteria bacterium]